MSSDIERPDQVKKLSERVKKNAGFNHTFIPLYKLCFQNKNQAKNIQKKIFKCICN